MFDFDKTPEQQAAEMARWNGIERRRAENATFRAQVDAAFPKPKMAICSQCGEHQSGPVHSDGLQGVRWVVCAECQSDAMARLTDTEPRNAYGYPEPARYPVGAALLIAGACASIFWGVIYLIISGGQ